MGQGEADAEEIQEFAPGLRKVKVHPVLLQNKATLDHLEEEGKTELGKDFSQPLTEEKHTNFSYINLSVK